MNNAEIIAVVVWTGNCCLADWGHARTILTGAKLMCSHESDDYKTLDFLHEIASERVNMEIKNGH